MTDPQPQTFRNALRFRNSPETIHRFPFPFEADSYRTSTNLEQHDRTGPGPAYRALFDIDAHYEAEMREKAFVLANDPARCQVLPHMAPAAWDALGYIMDNLARDFPADFGLDRAGERWHWRNRRLGIEHTFRFGEDASLPCGPLDYIGRQVQGDLILLDQRDGNLWLDGGILTAAQGWSLDFNLGMSWTEWHGPVTGANEVAVIDRGLAFTLALRPEAPVRRPNWIVCITPRLDNSLETYPEWGGAYAGAPPADIGRDVFLRVEMQQLFRLPRSNAVLFAIRVYMASLDDLATVPKWVKRLHRVFRDLPDDIERVKGLPFRREIVAWLAGHDDGTPLTQGRGPE